MHSAHVEPVCGSCGSQNDENHFCLGLKGEFFTNVHRFAYAYANLLAKKNLERWTARAVSVLKITSSIPFDVHLADGWKPLLFTDIACFAQMFFLVCLSYTSSPFFACHRQTNENHRTTVVPQLMAFPNVHSGSLRWHKSNICWVAALLLTYLEGRKIV